MSELSRQLLALRTGRTARRPRRTGRPPAPRITAPVYLDQRPAEAEGRAVPGHVEGDLAVGAHGQTAVATLVEPASRT